MTPSPKLTRAQGQLIYDTLVARGDAIASIEAQVLNGMGSWQYLTTAHVLRRWLDNGAPPGCDHCGGDGLNPARHRDSHAAYRGIKPCSVCSGTGEKP